MMTLLCRQAAGTQMLSVMCYIIVSVSSVITIVIVFWMVIITHCLLSIILLTTI